MNVFKYMYADIYVHTYMYIFINMYVRHLCGGAVAQWILR